MKEITVYTDGACSGNPGPGGWCAVLKYKDHEKILSGGEHSTTNNRMELSGAIAALEALKEPCRVLLVTDSQYLANGIGKGWAAGWRARGWKKSDGKPALNQDLWARLLELIGIHEVRFEWVKGHAGHPENERCDTIAVAESKKAAGEP
jgi:ribonuclease HI